MISTADENCHKVETLEQYAQLVDRLRQGSDAGECKCSHVTNKQKKQSIKFSNADPVGGGFLIDEGALWTRGLVPYRFLKHLLYFWWVSH